MIFTLICLYATTYKKSRNIFFKKVNSHLKEYYGINGIPILGGRGGFNDTLKPKTIK